MEADLPTTENRYMLLPSSLLLSTLILAVGNKGGIFVMFLVAQGWHSVLADDDFNKADATGESNGGGLPSCLGGFTPEEVLPVLLPICWLCELCSV